MSDKTAALFDHKVIAVLRHRTVSVREVLMGVDALYCGGIRAMEVTIDTSGAITILKNAKDHYGKEILFGFGTITTMKQLDEALEADPDFIVTPIFDEAIVRKCADVGTPILPGCFTPSEMFAATSAGAPAIKFFPAEVGGPPMIKAVLAPLPTIKVYAVGGVTLDNASDFFNAGAFGIGIGGNLVNDNLLKAGNFAEIERVASCYLRAATRGRESGVEPPQNQQRRFA